MRETTSHPVALWPRLELLLVVLVGALVASTALAQGPAFISDDFDRINLDTGLWTFVNPLGDGWVAMTGAGTADARLELSVPEGISHDPWFVNRSVRVMQACANGDFDVEAVFDSEPAYTYSGGIQIHGIIVEQDADNWLRFDIHHDGIRLLAYAGRTTNGVTFNVVNIPIVAGTASHLRVNRTGNLWTYYYSSDGISWATVTSFTRTLAVTAIGPFVANHGGFNLDGIVADSPAYTAICDYFFERSAPVVPEDGGAPLDTIAPFIHTVDRISSVTNELSVFWYTDEPCLGSIEYGATTGYGSIQSDGGGIYYHAVTLPGLSPGQTYHYRIVSDDGQGNVAYSDDFEILFLPVGPAIDVWYGTPQSFGVLGNPQPWVNILGNVTDPDGVQALSYTLNGGPDIALEIGPDGRRLESIGDFVVDLATSDLFYGNNTVVISAEDRGGSIASETVIVSYEVGNTWQIPYQTDWSGLAVDGDPATPDPAILEQAKVVDGKWSVDGATVRTVEPGYDRLIDVGDVVWNDYEATVSLTLHNTPPGYGVGLLMRWNGHTDDPVICPQPHCGWQPLGDIGWLTPGGLEFFEGTRVPFPATAETLYWLKMRVENNDLGVLYSVKAWPDGQAEPAGWMLTNQRDATTPQSGSMLLIAHEADVSFGDVFVEPVAQPNTIAIDGAAVPILSTAQACAEDIPFKIDRTDPTGLRGFSVTFALDGLQLCDGLNSITEGDYLSSVGLTEFFILDHLDGSYTVDIIILGSPCGATAPTGELFHVDVTNAISNGMGSISLESVIIRSCINEDLPVGAGHKLNIPIDTTPPAAVADLAAQQVLTGNAADGTTAIDLAWTPPWEPDAVSQDVYRKGVGFYPEYDDDGGAVPLVPSDPLGEDWELLASLPPAADSLRIPAGGPRDYWYGCVVCTDAAGNRSVAALSNGRPNYLLADVADGSGPPGVGNNRVGTEDLTRLGFAYGTSAGQANYLNYLDVGPTDDASISGLPQTDNQIDIEDLLIFGLSYGIDAGAAAKQPSAKMPRSLPAVATNGLRILPTTLPEPGQTFPVEVWMTGDGQIQGLSIALQYDEAVVQPLTGVQAGELLDAQDRPYILLSPAPGVADMVLLGAGEQGIIGEGVLVRMTFQMLDFGDPALGFGEVVARGLNNEPVEIDLQGLIDVPDTAFLPQLSELHPNVPNPFNPRTEIPFSISRTGRARLKIYGIDGRLVRTLVDEGFTPGRYARIWDGTDQSGRRVASGAYLVRLETPDVTHTRRVMLLK